MKILHTGDLHLGDLTGPIKDGENARRQDTLNCMRYIADTAAAERPNVTIIAGDTWNKSRVWADTALNDVYDALTTMIRPVCDCSDQVVMLYGTANHDNLKAYQVLREICADLQNLHIYTEPGAETIQTMDGPVQIAALPGYDKGRLRAFMPGIDAEQENRNATELINQVLVGLGAQIDKEIPSILVAHYTVAGCDTESGQTFLAGQDVVLLPTTIDSANFTLGTFGHIHKPQQLKTKTPCFYSGSPNQLTFNDEPWTQGFYIHEINGGDVESRFIETPSRRHKTVLLDKDEIAIFNATGTLICPEDISGKILRVKYAATPDQEKALNKAALQKLLIDSGAFFVSQIIPETTMDDTTKGAMETQDSPNEALRRWLDTINIDSVQASRLQEMAEPIIKSGEDSRDSSKHTGIFTPISIEVKNYRAYSEAEFSFADIKMAMVNGPNGIGKSSLFMDAIADCLYEQSRGEEIGGWVRDGEKSGSITFTFSIGDITYRVIRTRTKSGRGTLTLQRQDNAEWKDESDTTMKLTQDAIERTVGMNCQTFCSIALIRQDAYGIFLEAGSDQRMEVLSSLLGLDAYGRMEELSKAAEKERRKEIAQANDRINVLQQQIEEKEVLQTMAAALADKSSSANTEMTLIQEQLRMKENEEAMLNDLMVQIKKTGEKITSLQQKITKKEAEAQNYRVLIDANRTKAESLPLAEKAAQENATARSVLDEMDPVIEKSGRLTQEKNTLQNDITMAESTARRLTDEEKRLEAITARADEITAAKAEYERLEADKKSAEEIIAESVKLHEKNVALQNDLSMHANSTNAKLGLQRHKIADAKADAEILNDSGCPVLETAPCRFLTKAVTAKASLPDMEKELDTMTAAYDAEISSLESACKSAKEAEDLLPTDEAQQTIRHAETRMKELKAIISLEVQIAQAEAKAAEIKNQINTANAEIISKKKRLEEINAELDPLKDSMVQIDTLKQSIKSNSLVASMVPDCKAAKATIDAAAQTIIQITDEIAELTMSKEEIEKDEANLRQRIPRFAEGSNLDDLKNRQNGLQRIIQDTAEQRGEIKAKLQTIDEAEMQVGEYRRQKAKSSQELADYGILTKAFSLDGIQYMIVKNITPEIMNRANDILAAMTGGKMAVDIKTEREVKSTGKEINSLEVWIKNLAGTVRPYNSHSGGEKVRIALAVTLGLAEVKARHAGIQIGMLQIDEAPYLDGEGTEAYADALNELANRNPNMRILAISHDPAMKARFPQNITVSQGENGSTVTMD